MVVSNIFFFHLYLGKIPIFTIIFFRWVVQPPTRKPLWKWIGKTIFCLEKKEIERGQARDLPTAAFDAMLGGSYAKSFAKAIGCGDACACILAVIRKHCYFFWGGMIWKTDLRNRKELGGYPICSMRLVYLPTFSINLSHSCIRKYTWNTWKTIVAVAVKFPST